MAEKLEDLNLPNTVVTRLIKEALPDGQNSVVSKEARLALGKAASVFVLYVTSAATNVAKKSNRKTISAQDVIDAMNDLEFDNFVDPLKDALENFRQSQKEKKEANVKKKQHKADEDVHDEEENVIDDEAELEE